MSSEEFEKRFQNHVAFMIEQQARFDERLNKLEESQIQQTKNINQLAETVAAMQEEIREGFSEMREGFNNLIVANEVTRKLSEDVARLAIATSTTPLSIKQS